MKLGILVLTLVFGGLQTVSLTDCCCIAACEQPVGQASECHDCEGSSKEAADTAAPDDCCTESKAPVTPEPEKPGCVHVKASPDVVSHTHDVVVVPSAAFVLPVTEENLGPAVDSHLPRAFADLHRPERGRPLFLLNSALLS